MGLKGWINALKALLVLGALLLALVFAGMVPDTLRGLGRAFPEFEWLVGPALAAVATSALPLLVAFVAAWHFCSLTARTGGLGAAQGPAVKVIGICAGILAAFYALFAVFTMLQGAANPGSLLLFAGVVLGSVAVLAASRVYLQAVKGEAPMYTKAL